MDRSLFFNIFLIFWFNLTVSSVTVSSADASSRCWLQELRRGVRWPWIVSPWHFQDGGWMLDCHSLHWFTTLLSRDWCLVLLCGWFDQSETSYRRRIRGQEVKYTANTDGRLSTGFPTISASLAFIGCLFVN